MLRSIKSLGRIHHLCLRQVHHGSRIVRSSTFQPSTALPFSSNIIAPRPLPTTGFRAIHFGSVRFGPSEESLNESLQRIDSEIRRTGRINRRELEEILDDVRQLNSITSNQSLMIIRCCGELVPEETHENRTKLVQEVWKLMDKLKVPMDISHYNALLRVYLENEYMFNPTEFLQELSTKGLEPNRVTYQRLVTRFCHEGDIDGASTILQHMKEKQLPINVHVFNALVLGHTQSGDMESAEGILGVMRQAGLEPNDDSYATLMRGYAKKGDIHNIKRIVSDCEAKEIYLVDRDFLEVIYTLVSSNHEPLIHEIIPLIKRHAGFNQEMTNVILRLVAIGKEDVAFELLKQMPRQVRTVDAGMAPSGTFFIRQLVASDSVTPEKVLKICHEMVSSSLNRHALLRATEFALDMKKFEKAFDFIEALKECGFPIRHHYFWPFFAASKTEHDVYYGLKCMSYAEIEPNIETLRDYIIPALFNIPTKGTKTYDHILEKLSNYTTIPSTTLVPAALQYILQNAQLDIAASFALRHRVRFNHVGIRRALIDSYYKTRDAKAFVDIVASAGFDGDESAREAMGAILMDMLDTARPNNKVNLLTPILEECLAHGLGLSNSTLEWIQNNLGEALTPQLSALIVKLTSNDLTLSSSYFPAPGKGFVNYDEKSSIELEQMWKVAEESGRPTKGIRKALLLSYARGRNVEKAEDMYEKLANENFVFTPGMHAVLLDMYCEGNNLQKAKDMIKVISSSEFFILDDWKILRYAYLLIANGLEDECVEFLRSQARDEERVPQGAGQVGLVWKILNTVAEQGDVEKVKGVFNVLKDRGLTPVNNVVLGPIVKAHLVKNDLDGALREFETCVNEYSVTPWKNELFCRFIKADDADRLQKVLDLSTKQHGEINSLYDLIFAFLECGKVRQAKKIVETPGFRARNEKLEYICEQYLEDGKFEELEKLIEITRDVFNVDRNAMYFVLLKSYCKQGDDIKALSVWTSLQEENIQPSDEFMIYLADFLKSKDVQVPFAIPEKKGPSEPISNTILPQSRRDQSNGPQKQERKVRNPGTVSETLDPISQELRSYLQKKELDKALEFQQRVESGGRQLSVSDMSLLILRMSLAGRLTEATRLANQMFLNGAYPNREAFRIYCIKLGAAGDIDTLLHLDAVMNEDLKRMGSLNSCLCNAYVEAGRAVEYFETYVKGRILTQNESNDKPRPNEMVPVAAASRILQQHPELLPQFEALEKEVKHGENQFNFNNILWIFYLREKNYEKADRQMSLMKENFGRYPGMGQVLKFQPILKDATDGKDEELITKLANEVMPNDFIGSGDKGSCLKTQLEILCEMGKPTEALKALKCQLDLKRVEITDLTYPVIYKLKEALEAAHLQFPYELPPKASFETGGRRRVKKVESSSESSESDSD